MQWTRKRDGCQGTNSGKDGWKEREEEGIPIKGPCTSKKTNIRRKDEEREGRAGAELGHTVFAIHMRKAKHKVFASQRTSGH